MPTAKKIKFKDLIVPLLDENTPFPARYLHHFSDLNQSDEQLLAQVWPKVSLKRRQALMEDLELLGEADDLLNFEAICRLGMQDADELVRTTAVSILSDYEEIALLPIFLDLAEHDESVIVRAAAASALGPFVYSGEMDLIPDSVSTQLTDSLLALATGKATPVIRMRALESLGYSSRPEVIPLIEAAYDSGDQEWLRAALFAMGRSANAFWKSHVLEMLEDQRPEVRSEAAIAAGGLEVKSARKRLLELLDDDDSEVRLAAIWALSNIGGAGVADALNKMLENSEDEEEAQLLEDALDNLAFTDGIGGFEMLDLSSEDGDEEDDDLPFSEDQVDEDED